MTEPVIPVVFEVMWYVIPILYVGLLVAAIIVIVRTPFLSSAQRVGWTLVSIVIPILGPLAWFASYVADPRRRK